MIVSAVDIGCEGVTLYDRLCTHRTGVFHVFKKKPLHHKILASEALDIFIEDYSLGGATPQMSPNEQESYDS